MTRFLCRCGKQDENPGTLATKNGRCPGGDEDIRLDAISYSLKEWKDPQRSELHRFAVFYSYIHALCDVCDGVVRSSWQLTHECKVPTRNITKQTCIPKPCPILGFQS